MNKLEELVKKGYFSSMADQEEAFRLATEAYKIGTEKPKLHPAQKALRQIRQRANDPGTLRQHGPKFVEGLRCAANMLSDAINKGK